MNEPQDNSVNAHEDEASEKIFPDIQEHVNYLNDVYNLCFAIQLKLGGTPIHALEDYFRAQLMILMRITDFLRPVILLCAKGYPEQAATLTASIFELAHTAVVFSYKPEAAKQWLESDDLTEKVPQLFKFNNWKCVVKENCKQSGNPDMAEHEYYIYKQLCWMKHSHP
jgi:hypothetical protein